MNYTRNIVLFGQMISRNRARYLLENHPNVLRIDSDDDNSMRLKLVLSNPMSDMTLLSLLKGCELSGVQFMKESP